MTKIICIAGMHRSGTSLVSSWLEGCGLKLFETIEPNVGNPLGHFEDREILDIHMAAINRMDRNSKGWIINRHIKPGFNESEKNKIKELLQIRERQNLPLWGWKEPRTTLFLDEWKRIIPDLKVILLWRSGRLVYDSLLRRAEKSKHAPVMQISENEALENWTIYNKKVLKYYLKNEKDSILINIDEMLEYSDQFISYVNNKFDIKLSNVSLNQYYNKDLINVDFKTKYKISWLKSIFFQIEGIEKKLVKNSFFIYEQ